jgi:GDPmannose 4,6-dehydratase
MDKDMKVAVISGVTGQTGSYLAELLLTKGYFVIGFSRRVSVDTSERIKHLFTNPNFQFEEGDICDSFYITNLLQKYRVAEFYNLAAQSHVGTSFKQPVVTSEINYGGVLNILNCIQTISPETKFYQASTSELFGANYDTREHRVAKITEGFVHAEGNILPISVDDMHYSFSDHDEQYTVEKYQDENTAMKPQSPYAIAKLASHNLVRLYRESYNIYACAGILFNHESPRRGEKFVTRKITKWIGELYKFCNGRIENLYTVDKGFDSVYSSGSPAAGKGVTPSFDAQMPKLRLGNLDSSRDWGHAKDYAEAMYLMLQQENPDDYVVSTQETHTIREFLDLAFKKIGVDSWENFVVIDPKYFRPAEVDYLMGDSTKARSTLDWQPTYTFETLVDEMVESEVSKCCL